MTSPDTHASAALAEAPLEALSPQALRGADLLEKIDFDAYQQITFRPEDSLFKGTRYPVRLFHLGRYFKSPVKIAIVEGNQSRDVLYSPDLFTLGPKARPIVDKLPDNLGFAGDRRFLVIDEAGKFITQRQVTRMALVSTALTGQSPSMVSRCNL